MLTIKTAGFEEYLDPSGGAWIKALVLGAHGAGKTRSSAFWPDPIIADCEHGLMSVSDLRTPYAHITSATDMDALLELLRRDSMQPAEARKYRTVIIDTIDSYQRALVAERLKSERKEAMSGWADWGWLNGKMAQLIEKLVNLPINVVVNMHVKDEKDEDGEASILVKKSALKGESGDTIYRDFDLIGLMETSYEAIDGERVLTRAIRWHSEPRFPMLRDRSGRLPRFTDIDFTDEDYFRIFKAITSGVDLLPETTTLEELVTETDTTTVPGPDVAGGPVSNVKLPKAPAKRAAKKAAAKVPEQRQPVQVEEVGTPADAPADPMSVDDDDQAVEAEARAAVALLEENLGAVEVAEVEQETPPAEPEEPAPARVVRHCGDQSPGITAPPVPGCGKELTAQNAMKVQMAQLRTKTLLCDADFEAWKADN